MHYADDPFVVRRPVEDHLHTALDASLDDLDQGAIGGIVDFNLEWARIAIEMRRRLVAGSGDPWLDQQVASLVADDPTEDPTELIDALSADDPLPPVRYAMAIQLSRDFATQLPDMMSRLLRLSGCLGSRAVAPAARPYVKEAVEAFLFGLRAGAIALARAGFEHAAQDWLVSRKHMGISTARRLAAGALLAKLVESGALSASAADAAKSLIGRGNGVMHRGQAEPAEQADDEKALASIEDLRAVLEEMVA
jgi:hypothetical protein